MANPHRIDVKIWLKDELWRYQIDAYRKTFDPRSEEVEHIAEGFSDDFDALLQEALQQAEEHAEVLRRG